MSAKITVGGEAVGRGRKVTIALPITRLPTGGAMTVPIIAINGRFDGPRVWLSAAVHGDELNGIEVVRAVVDALSAKTLKGTLIAAPVVNPFGLLGGDRYLPDRRDLNRSFPGSRRGSLASRLAHLFMETVVAGSDVGLDLHTASNHRENHPQIRADLADGKTRELAEAFAAPILIQSKQRDGSLRQAGVDAGQQVLVYEAGEAMRYNRASVEIGVGGVLRVLQHLDMITEAPEAPPQPPHVVTRSSWVRAKRGGLLSTRVELGAMVEKGETLGRIADTVGGRPMAIRATTGGVVLGINHYPVINKGDAVAHVGEVETAG